MKRRISPNSRAAYAQLLLSGQIESEKKLVMEILHNERVLTNRQITYLSGLERGNICRVLNDLLNKENKIRIVEVNPCEITGKMVNYYSLIVNKKEESNE